MIPKDTTPEELEKLAEWSQKQDKWLNDSDQIYRLVFYECLDRLKKMKNTESRRRSSRMVLNLGPHLRQAVKGIITIILNCFLFIVVIGKLEPSKKR